MPESVNASVSTESSPMPDLTTLETSLATGSDKVQLQAAQDLFTLGIPGQQRLQSFLLARQSEGTAVTWVDARCYELLLAAETPEAQQFLQQHFPTGVVPLTSEVGVDYLPLQQYLARQQFLEADRLTLQKLCELAGPAAMKRKWVYFSEVESFPTADLKTINYLWLMHSEGKFGFSVQRQLWLSVSKNWDALWPKIQWKSGKDWTRYPQGFKWDLSAPKGHLPLSNQLRGVRMLDALLSHPAWTTSG